MKYVIIIGDGMADDPVKQLCGKTPLEAAKKPVIDSLAKNGQLGKALTVPEGFEAGSDTAILSIFGYSPCQYFTGRSPLEAAALDVLLEDNQVSYRCNMVALSQEAVYEDRRILSHSGGCVGGETALELMQFLLANPEFEELCHKNKLTFKLCPSFRHIAVQTGLNVSGLVCAPPHENLNRAQGPLLPQGSAAAAGLRSIMRLSNKLLSKHPANKKRQNQGMLCANSLWFWAQGTGVSLPNFTQKHGKSGFVVSAVPLVQGIGRLAGLGVVQVNGATGELETNYEGKAAAIVNGLVNGADFALLHVEAPDECTHNGDLNGKIQAIEWLDSRTISPIINGLNKAGEAFKMLIVSDHKTLIANGCHHGAPVPFILFNSQNKGGSGLAYTEKLAEQGEYIEDGTKLICRLFEA